MATRDELTGRFVSETGTTCGTLAGYKYHKKHGEEACRDCKTAKTQYERGLRNKDTELARKKEAERRELHREEYREYSRVWKQANRDRVRELNRESSKRHPETSRKSVRSRRARKLSVESSPYTTQEVLDRYGTVCHACSKEIDLSAPRHTRALGWEYGLHLDHLIPLSKGGSDTIENIRPAHAICNFKKGSTIKDVLNGNQEKDFQRRQEDFKSDV